MATVGYPKAFLAVVCILFSVEMIVGLCLNLFVMWKHFKDKGVTVGKRQNGHNFIVTLKVIDLVICALVIPLSLTVLVVDMWNNTAICFIKEGLVVFASSASSAGVLLISIDRYSAVVLPTKKIITATRVRMCRWCVVIVGLIGLILPSLCLVMGNYTTGLDDGLDVLTCRYVIWVFQPYYVYDVYYIIAFIITVGVVTFCYRSVIKVVKRRMTVRALTFATSTVTAEHTAKVFRFRQQEFKATRIAFGLVLAFLICWGPHVIVTLIQLSFPSSVAVDMVQSVCLIIAFLTPIIHPIIYTFEKKDAVTAVRASKSISGPLFGHVKHHTTTKVSPDETAVDSVASNEQNASNRAQQVASEQRAPVTVALAPINLRCDSITNVQCQITSEHSV